MSSKGSLKLCTTCKNIDFVSLVYPSSTLGKNEEIPKISLGTLGDMFARSQTCDFCSMIVGTARRKYKLFYNDDYRQIHPELGMPLQWNEEPIRAVLEPMFFCQFETRNRSSDAREPHEINRLRVELKPCPWHEQEFDSSMTYHAFWHGGYDEMTPDDPTVPEISRVVLDDKPEDISYLGSGRLTTPDLNLNLVRKWLQKCEKEHNNTCASPNWLPESDNLTPKGLRVIDVIDHCLVTAPRNCRYLALSYVWGTMSQTVRRDNFLTREKLSALYVRDSLGKHLHLPATLRDAMEFTRRLGERYLWVDAMCIVQDDTEELQKITAQMDLVYGGALLVIIAAAGIDANYGLPGIGSRVPRSVSQRRAQVAYAQLPASDDKSLNTFSLMESVLQGSGPSLQFSTWNNRGWTFQERLLARRAVIVTEHQAYWVCEQSMWDEETHLELGNYITEHRMGAKSEKNSFILLPQRLGCNDEFDDGFPKFTLPALSIYIVQYSTRLLTFPEDKKNAFSGIERRCSSVTGVKFHWGLSENMFDQDLSFAISGFRPEGLSCRLDHDQGESVRVQYPSWSWMAWTGFIGSAFHNGNLRNQREKGVPSSQPLVIFYSLYTNGSIRAINGDESPPKPTDTDEGSAQDDARLPSWRGEPQVIGPIACVSGKDGKLKYVDSGITSDEGGNLPTFDSKDGSQLLHDTGRLVFWTSCAKLKAVQGKSSTRLEILPLRNEMEPVSNIQKNIENDMTKLKIADGSIGKAISTQIDHEPQQIDCIVVSWHYDVAKVDHNGMLDLLVVEWDDKLENVCRRLNKNTVSNDVWEKYEPVWRLVVLE